MTSFGVIEGWEESRCDELFFGDKMVESSRKEMRRDATRSAPHMRTW